MELQVRRPARRPPQQPEAQFDLRVPVACDSRRILLLPVGPAVPDRERAAVPPAHRIDERYQSLRGAGRQAHLAVPSSARLELHADNPANARVQLPAWLDAAAAV